MTDSKVAEEQVFTEEEKQILIQKGLLLQQLMESEKFCAFVAMNYDVCLDTDTSTMYVVEVPDKVAAERALDLMKREAENGPIVRTATTVEASKILNDPDLLNKIRKDD